ncbi:unnamed protein product, partial [Callosobruchus maculatus]
MSTAITNGHNTSTEDFTKHIFGGIEDTGIILSLSYHIAVPVLVWI